MRTKRTYTPEQKARRKAWRLEYLRRPDKRERYLEAKRQAMKRYYQAHKAEVRARVRSYQERNREQIVLRKRAAYVRDRERILAAQKEYARKYPELVSANKRSYYARHRERILAYHREYIRKNPDKLRMWHQMRRAREMGAPGRFTELEFRALVSLHQGRCAYCGATGTLVPDHRIPLSRPELGPTNFIEDILPACPPCNTQKGSKTEQEYRDWLLRLPVPRRGRS